MELWVIIGEGLEDDDFVKQPGPKPYGQPVAQCNGSFFLSQEQLPIDNGGIQEGWGVCWGLLGLEICGS